MIGFAVGFYGDWQNGRDPASITTQDPEQSRLLGLVEAGSRLANHLCVLVLEAQAMARAPFAGTYGIPRRATDILRYKECRRPDGWCVSAARCGCGLLPWPGTGPCRCGTGRRRR